MSNWTSSFGQAHVGSYEVSNSAQFNQEYTEVLRDRTVRFFSGVVKAVRHISDPSGQREHLILTLLKANGETVDETINVHSFWLGDERRLTSIGLGDSLSIVVPKMTQLDQLKLAWQNSNLVNIVERSFGKPPASEDFKVAYALVETLLSVPPTYGPTAVIKILLGRQIRNGDSFPHFGLVKGQRRYSEKALRRFLTPVHKFMRLTGVLSDETDSRVDVPEYLVYIKRTDLSPVMLKMWSELRDAPPALTSVTGSD